MHYARLNILSQQVKKEELSWNRYAKEDDMMIGNFQHRINDDTMTRGWHDDWELWA